MVSKKKNHYLCDGGIEKSICVSKCMVCVYVREDNPRALVSGFSPIHTHSYTITFLLHQHACAFFTL